MIVLSVLAPLAGIATFALLTLAVFLWAEELRGAPGPGSAVFYLLQALLPGLIATAVLALSTFRWRAPELAGWARFAGGVGVLLVGAAMSGVAEVGFILTSDWGDGIGPNVGLDTTGGRPWVAIAIMMLAPITVWGLTFAMSAVCRWRSPAVHGAVWLTSFCLLGAAMTVASIWSTSA
ncbi:hypothetical protein [Frondihabitans sp. PAMC 28766]|uniref:hypothetical protein n=1 Tax=Frondihabitans sp. PAMC 28766 TaxID=1795630 RepID=UPI0012FFA7B5|nr:hypothetical protein [Frondihabitans sp. PAMC 28766]